MEALTIELNNPKAISVIKELENLNLLRIVDKKPQSKNIADLLFSCISNE
jgi:hypothetical protein